MKIRLENVNLNSNSGPNSFAQKLVKEFQVQGHSFVSKDYDSALCFIEDRSNLPGKNLYQRLDGIYFNTQFNYDMQNSNILKTYQKAQGIIYTEFNSTTVRITVIEDGNREVSPTISLTQVNEELGDVKQFEIDAATEFMWALAAVIGCFVMVLGPSFIIYWAAQAKQKKLDVKLEAAKTSLEQE